MSKQLLVEVSPVERIGRDWESGPQFLGFCTREPVLFHVKAGPCPKVNGPLKIGDALLDDRQQQPPGHRHPPARKGSDNRIATVLHAKTIVK